MDKVLNMTYASSLTDLREANSSFDYGVLRICYTGENRNHTSISKEALERSIHSIYDCPIVCNYNRDTDSLGGHDIELVRYDDGSMRIVNVTAPIGCVPESARVWFENYTEEDGTENEYLYTEVLLWKRQEAYQKIKKDGITAQSMEINVSDGESIDGVFHINNFEFTAFALLGDCEPCFESAALEVFSKGDLKKQISEMMLELKDSNAKVNSYPEGDKSYQKYSTEGGEKVMEDEMIKDKSEMEFTADGEVKPSEVDSVEETDKVFALASEQINELRRVLGGEKVQREWGEVSRYEYIDCDFELGEVYACDCKAGHILFGFPFTVDGDKVTIDFANGKRKKFAIVDFEEGAEPEEPVAPLAPAFELLDQKCADLFAKEVEYSDLETKFANASKTISDMETELEELRTFKAETETAIAASERSELFAQFEDLDGVEAFEALRDDCMKYDLNTLEEKCFAIRGRKNSTMNFSAKDKAPKLMVGEPDISDEPYGGLFVKYAVSGLD